MTDFPFDLVGFDLDGTLLDTAWDLGVALNHALEAAGVDSVKELALRNAEHLHTKLVQTNDQYGLSGKVPSRESLEAMVAQAKTMERKVTH